MVFSASLRTSSATTANPRPASPRGSLNGGVESQQIGLIRNVRYDAHDPINGTRVLIEPGHVPLELQRDMMDILNAADGFFHHPGAGLGFFLVSPEAEDAEEALRATSCTVAFISFMAAAASERRWALSAALRSDCSILAESSAEAGGKHVAHFFQPGFAMLSRARVLAWASCPATSAFRHGLLRFGRLLPGVFGLALRVFNMGFQGMDHFHNGPVNALFLAAVLHIVVGRPPRVRQGRSVRRGPCQAAAACCGKARR